MTKWANLSTAGKVWRVVWVSTVIAFVVWVVIGLSVGSGQAQAALSQPFGAQDSDASLGGTVNPLDQETDTWWSKADSPTQGKVAAAVLGPTTFTPDPANKTRNDHLACGTAKFQKYHTNIWGAHLFTTHHRVYFCVDSRYPNRCRISRVDSQVFVDINTAGTIGQWHKDYGQKSEHFFPWRRGNIRSGYASTKIVHFWRGATIFGNDVVLGRSQIASHIRLHCNGHYWRG